MNKYQVDGLCKILDSVATAAFLGIITTLWQWSMLPTDELRMPHQFGAVEMTGMVGGLVVSVLWAFIARDGL